MDNDLENTNEPAQPDQVQPDPPDEQESPDPPVTEENQQTPTDEQEGAPSDEKVLDHESIQIEADQEQVGKGDEEEIGLKDEIDEKTVKILGSEFPASQLKELLPWFISMIVGIILLLVAVIMLVMNSGYTPVNLSKLKVPSFQSSVVVTSLDGKPLKFTHDLKYIGSLQSRKLRHQVEPKFTEIYGASGLDAESVLVLNFKYGSKASPASTSSSSTSEGSSPQGKAAGSENKDGVTVLHWIFLENPTTKTPEEIAEKMKTVIAADASIVVDPDSISLVKLTNLTNAGTLSILSQYGFFMNGIQGLDLAQLQALNIGYGPNMIGIQSDSNQGLCPELVKPLHGTTKPASCHNSMSTYAGLTCSLECEEGYYAPDFSTQTCLSSGKWSGESFSCLPICKPLGSMTFGVTRPANCRDSNKTVGSMCFTQCFPSQSLSFYHSDEKVPSMVSFFRECLPNGEWSGDYGVCKAKCPKLSLVHHTIQPASCMEDPEQGDVCTVTCDPGFILTGGGNAVQIVCGNTGVWQGSSITCKKTCPALSVTGFTSILPSVCLSNPYDGLICSFECESGHHINGSDESVCMPDGTWSVHPTCVKHCDSLGSVEFGLIKTSKGSCSAEHPVDGSECILVCKSGYVSSLESITCSNGAWSAADWTCQKTCTPLETVGGTWQPSSCTSDGHHQGSSSCDLTCDLGSSVGSTGVTCDPISGLWSDTPGMCDVQCTKPALPTNSAVEPSDCTVSDSSSDAVCQFMCDPGFMLDGEATLTCLGTGMWSSAAPTCIVQPQFVMRFDSTEVSYCIGLDQDNKLVKHFDLAEECTGSKGHNRWTLLDTLNLKNFHSGMCLTNSESFLQLTSCDITDKKQHFHSLHQFQVASWDKLSILGGPRGSSKLVVGPLSSKFEETLGWRFFDVATWDMYTLHGARNNGACPPIDMAGSVTVDASCHTNVQASAAVCDITCASGYKLSNPSVNQITCTLGVWNILLDMCVPDDSMNNKCPPIKTSMSNIIIEPKSCTSDWRNFDSVCKLSCSDDNMYLDGPSSMVCSDQGSWMPDEGFQCKRYCPALQLKPNSYFVAGHSSTCESGMAKSGDICGFECAELHSAMSNSMLSCTDIGSWDGQEPSCLKVCDPIPSDGNLNVKCNNKLNNRYNSGTTCQFSCSGGLKLEGLDITECRDGSWTYDFVPRCVKVCPAIPEQAEYKYIPATCNTNTSSVGSMCEMECNNGMKMMYEGGVVDSIHLTCSEQRQWIGPIPNCVTACKPIKYDGPADIVPISCTSTSQIVGTLCNFNCHNAPTDASNSNVNARCTEDGTWQHSTTECEEGCPPLHPPRNAIVAPQSCAEGLNARGTVCALKCPDHMDIVGPVFRTCLKNTDGDNSLYWSTTDPTACVERCPRLQLPPDTMAFPLSCSYGTSVTGDVCTFDCKTGHKLNGETTLTCYNTGVWNYPVPNCLKFCPSLLVSNGYMLCSPSISPYSPIGYYYSPGTNCMIVCDEGYIPLEVDKTVCLEDGTWSSQIFCQRKTGLFTIFQKLDDATKCLAANQFSNTRDLFFGNSSDTCIALGNDALWFWSGNMLKHVATGYCLTGVEVAADSILILRTCDENDVGQLWSSDSFYPYRITLLGSSLAIDTTYPEVGPMLQPWTHANSYWMAFNEDLGKTAAISSFKIKGVCPGITSESVSVSPKDCATDDVTVWKSCQVKCLLDESKTLSTQCLPTGVWEEMENFKCEKMCPSLPTNKHNVYEPLSCSTGSMEELSSCTVTCLSDAKLANGERQTSVFCEDGKWSDDIVNCSPYCDAPPSPPHSTVKCVAEICTAVCNQGFTDTGNSSITSVECLSSGLYNAQLKLSCERDSKHFRIQAATAVFSCLSLVDPVSNASTVLSKKSPCSSQDPKQYWMWKDDMLVHVFTGLCLAVVDSASTKVISGMLCDASKNNQHWSCGDQLKPFQIKSTIHNSILDVGPIGDMTPAYLAEEGKFVLGDWYGVNYDEIESKTICSYKGDCPALNAGPTAKVMPSSCAGKFNETCKIECNMGFAMANNNSVFTCEATGIWSRKVPACLPDGDGSTCPKIEVTAALHVNYECVASQNIPSGTQCKFSCSHGYYLDGERTSYCDESGQWTQPLPTCKAYCYGLNAESNSMITPSVCSSVLVAAGTECTQTCSEGYATNVASVRTCLFDGSWSGDEVVCKVACPPLSYSPILATDQAALVTSGSKNVITSTGCAENLAAIDTTCTLSCPEGFVLDGMSETTCGIGGVWSQAKPRCFALFHCPEADSKFEKADIVYEPLLKSVAVIPGTAMYITCPDGFNLLGDSERICTKAGTWDGMGSQNISCVKQCSPLSIAFPESVTPVSCSTGYFMDEDVCSLNCPSKNSFHTVECTDGEWVGIDDLPSCLPYYDKTVRSPRVSLFTAAEKREFMIITRSPMVGCLGINLANEVQWSDKSQCNPMESRFKWKWLNSGNVVNVLEMKCLKTTVSMNTTYLAVGKCDSNPLTVECGNPSSSSKRFAVYVSGSSSWQMYYVQNVNTTLPDRIEMEKTPAKLEHFFPDYFDSLSLSANEYILDSQATDKPICSYGCGKTISEDPQHGFISYGYFEDSRHPPFTECEWTLIGYQSKIKLTLTLLSLLEFEQYNGVCTKNCIEVYRGSDSNPSNSELVETYSGNDVLMYKETSRTVIQSVSTSLFIRFKGKGDYGENGFVFTYEYIDYPGPTNCGKMDSVNASALETTVEDKLPWMVSLQVMGHRKKTAAVCAGVLLNADTIVTAAHCAANVEGLRLSDVIVAVGQNKLTKAAENALSVDRVFVNPDYDAASREGNIALWKLVMPVGENYFTKPMCAPMDGFPVHSPLQTCYAVGWTDLATGAMTDIMNEYAVKIESASWCSEEMGLSSQQKMICAQFYGMEESYLSQNSEALVCMHRERWYLVGVASHTHVGVKSVYRLYTSIHHSSAWLKHTLHRTSVVSYKSMGIELNEGADMKRASMWFHRHN